MSQTKSIRIAEEEAEVRPPPLPFSRQRLGRRLLINRLATVVVRGGGVAILFSILAIFLVIFWEAWPIFRGSSVSVTSVHPSIFRAQPFALGSDERGATVFAVEPDGVIRFISLSDGREILRQNVPIPPASSITAAAQETGSNRLLLVRKDGALVPLQIGFPASTAAAGEGIRPSVEVGSAVELPGTRSIEKLRAARGEDGSVLALVRRLDSGDLELGVHATIEKTNLMGEVSAQSVYSPLPLLAGTQITALELSANAKLLLAGTASGSVLLYDLRNPQSPQQIGTQQIIAQTPISALRLLLGDLTLVTGSAKGDVSSWVFVGGMPLKGGKLTKVHDYPAHPTSIVEILRSERNRTFLTYDESGEMRLSYGTTGKQLVKVPASGFSSSLVRFAGRGDQLVQLSAKGGLRNIEVHNPHPEASLAALFGPVWYEGYSEPTYVWQSSSGSDEFEPKLSLVPLIYGTMKGTFYSLLFAVPIAVFGAIYTSEFMSARLKSIVKPIIELMAALPSVVLGFIAGVWLAPVLGPLVPGLFLLPLVLALCTLIAIFGFQRLPLSVRQRFTGGGEVLLLVPVVLLSLYLSFQLGYGVEAFLLGENYQHWMSERLGIAFDQRNSLVVGVAMGFAIIPLIFTISEDSISSIPGNLRAASLALGASTWQTAMRVVLPAASPGIFSAIMLGFGRAIGETMIVLMATGNTPTMDPSMFSGFRAVSANIAVELPEAAVGGTLFRILFFAALLLFCLTFMVNTATELVRIKLRRRFGQY